MTAASEPVAGDRRRERTLALAAALAATAVWGFAPLLYKALAPVPALEVLAHRTLWSLAFILAFSLAGGRRRGPRLAAALTGRATLPAVAAGALLVGFNWGLFIWAIQSAHTVDASLGYYVFPVVSVALGVAVLGERLRPAQWAGVGLAGLAVTLLGLGLGTPPWIALALALSFAAYGMVKKLRPIGPIVSVGAECVLLAPLAAGYLAGAHALGWGGAGAGAFAADLRLSLLLILAGPVTGLPLVLFAHAARVLKLSSIGLIFYINPTLQLLVAVLVFGEAITPWHGLALALIWPGIALFTHAAWRQERAASSTASAASASGTTVR